jgi:hypothetical protein
MNAEDNIVVVPVPVLAARIADFLLMLLNSPLGALAGPPLESSISEASPQTGSSPAEPVVPVPTVTQKITVQILPDGRMIPKNAGLYLGKAEKTLATWRTKRKGPKWVKIDGRVYYYQSDLDAYAARHRM